MSAIQRVLILLCSLLDGFRSRHFHPTEKAAEATRHRVLIATAGIIGDGVCFLDSLRTYPMAFPAEQGYRITYALKPMILKFYQACGIRYEGETLALDYHRYCQDFAYYRQIRSQLRRQDYGIVIIAEKSISAAIMALSVRAERKVMAKLREAGYREPFAELNRGVYDYVTTYLDRQFAIY